MKTIVLAAFLMWSVAAWPEQPNPLDYPVTVHVVSSRYVTQPEGSKFTDRYEVLQVLVSGKKYELRGEDPPKLGHSFAIIVPGDYKARVTSDHQKNGYLIHKEYELLFPDGSKSKFYVLGESE